MPEEVFSTLLDWLHPDNGKAEIVYAQLRTRIARFFEANGCRFADDYADETLERVAERLSKGTEVLATDPYVYARGVARNVMMEKWRQDSRFVTTVDSLLPHHQPLTDPHKTESEMQERSTRERLLECLDGCLKKLPDDSRQFFLDYHQDQEGTKIDSRALIAERLGIDVTALRNRITRLRKKIEACATDCAQQG